MVQVQAWQLIYSNVEKEQSPRGRGGFQTLFYSRAGLDPAEVEEMEARLLYVPSEIEPVKRVFFHLSGGRPVLAQIVPLEDPDQSGRRGRYLAHALVFAAEDWPVVAPWPILRQFPFVTTVEGALAQGDFSTGDLAPAVVRFDPEPDLLAARAWSPRCLAPLARLALRAEALARERTSVVFLGSPGQIAESLEAAFLALPAALWPACTFDTYFYRCNLVATYYWAVGLADAAARPNLIRVGAAAHRVLDPLPDAPEERAYETWAAAAIEAGDLPLLAQSREAAFALCRWLEGQSVAPDALGAVPEAALRSVFQVHAALVRTRLFERLQECLPPALAERLLALIVDQAGVPALFEYLRAGFERGPLLDELFRFYEGQQFLEPPREERRALERLLEEVEHPLLELLLAGWRNQRQVLQPGLERIDEAGYLRFAGTALSSGLVDPLDLLVPGRGGLFLDLYLSEDVPAEGLVDLAGALLGAGEAAGLDRLLPYLGACSRRERRALQKMAQKHPVPEAFRQAVLGG